MITYPYSIEKLPVTRGREGVIHVWGKQALGLLFISRRFLAVFEHLLADVVASRRATGGMRTACGEHETTNRNVRSNVRRDFANGCNSLVMLVPDESARAAVRRLLRRTFPRTIWSRIGVLTYADCRRQLEKLVTDSASPAAVLLRNFPHSNKQP